MSISSAQPILTSSSAAPSAIVAAIQATGRDAILRGSGASDGNSNVSHGLGLGADTSERTAAAVCILETHAKTVPDHVRGLARMVQVSPTLTLVDLTLKGLSPGVYRATIHSSGDISRGAASVGAVWNESQDSTLESNGTPRGIIGTVEIGLNRRGGVFFDRPIQIWEIIGRGMVISKLSEDNLSQNDPDTLVGVIARSAGVWDNEKTVCSCSGKTIWEERKERVEQGIL